MDWEFRRLRRLFLAKWIEVLPSTNEVKLKKWLVRRKGLGQFYVAVGLPPTIVVVLYDHECRYRYGKEYRDQPEPAWQTISIDELVDLLLKQAREFVQRGVQEHRALD